MADHKAKPYAHDGSIYMISGCCKDVVLQGKEDWPSIDLEKVKDGIAEIPSGEGECDFCGKKNDVPVLKLRVG